MNSAQHIVFSLVGLLTIVGSACTKETAPDCVKKLGTMTQIARTLDAFETIEIDGRIKLHLIQDSVNYAEISFGEALLPGVHTDVRDGVLEVFEDNQCDFLRDQQEQPEVWVHYRSLSSIISTSSSSITFDNACTSRKLEYQIIDVAGTASVLFEGDSLSVINHTGSTDVTIAGKAHFVYLYSASYAPIDAAALDAEVGSLHSEGTGDISIRATNVVYVQLFDWANAHIYGPANIVVWHHEGSGEIIREED